jgi:hypothetical protein
MPVKNALYAVLMNNLADALAFHVAIGRGIMQKHEHFLFGIFLLQLQPRKYRGAQAFCLAVYDLFIIGPVIAFGKPAACSADDIILGDIGVIEKKIYTESAHRIPKLVELLHRLPPKIVIALGYNLFAV